MTLPLLVSLIGLTSCVLVISINFLTATRTNRQTLSKRVDLVLIYSRCILDIFAGFAVISFIGVIILKTLDINKVTVKTTYFVVFSSLPSVFIWTTRFVLSIWILVWRMACLCWPQITKTCGLKIACISILIISFIIGIVDMLVFFIGCPVNFVAHPGCMALGCMTGPCFILYSTINRAILFSLTSICALAFSLLICFCETKETHEKRVVETDYWFLLCMLNTTVFNCIPFAVTIIGRADLGSNHFGPFVNTLNMLGACFDAVIVSKIFETHQFF